MVDKEDNFNEFLKQKVEESHFEFNDAYWMKAEKLIANVQPKRKPFWWGFGWGAVSIALIGGLSAVVWHNSQQKSTVGVKTLAAQTSLASVQTIAQNKQSNQADQLLVTTSLNSAAKTADLQGVYDNGTLAAKTLPKVSNNGNEKQANLASASKYANANKQAKEAPLTANVKGLSESYFNKVKSLNAPKLPESVAKQDEEESVEEEAKVITIAEPFVMHAKSSSIKDIDVNVVAACENKNKHEWMFSVLGGVSDSRGFEGNTVSSSKIGFGYFGGFRLAYKIDKNWFVGAQPLMYSRGAINTSVEKEKTAYDFGSNADEFIVKNKALLFAELPISIGYRIQRHQISLGAGMEYLVNVKSDVKAFNTTDYQPNQWGYTEGFNRFGTMAIFNYAFNVYNEFWITMMVQKGFTDMTKANYFTTNSSDKNFNLRIGVQYLFNQEKKKGQ